ncbi:T9SS type A sorting domain-containing protein [Cryomorpha ignava]|uniref:T9SS type A sorting domain-containing protein n=1 Tax=Cryomorpha ignava TaxID=101383 RepID=A0A7K3WTW1_9FLAO|nr:T9SS type A sorting domain-containing protein [Cryomorpha ignava]NEN24471.1 T9SS type A sorting domain-containing protein [Cryomorpha ignava]
MKIIFTTSLFIGFLGTIYAQLIIDGSNFTQAGTVLNYETASPAWTANQNLIATSGGAALWNAEDWVSITENTETYIPISGLSSIIQIFFNNNFLYPATFSTHAIAVGAEIVDLPLPVEISDGYAYFRNDETGYYNTGSSFAVQGFPLVTQNELVERIFKFPMQFGDTDTSALAFLTSIPTLGAFGQNATRFSEVDGEGVLTTPYGSYDVLRVRAERYITDTVFIEQLGGGQSVNRPLQIDYAWISPEMQAPILEMSVVENLVISARMLKEDGTVGIKEYKNSGFAIYPNPVKDYIHVETPFPERAQITLYDMQGRMVLETKLQSETISLKKMNPGIYLVKISGIHETFVEKLIITE